MTDSGLMFDDNERSHCKRKIEFCEIKAFYFSSQFKKRYPVQKNGAENTVFYYLQ